MPVFYNPICLNASSRNKGCWQTMQGDLVKTLHLDIQPVGISFANMTAVCDLIAGTGKRTCIIAFHLSAAHGKVVGVTEEDCICLGGTVGCCFGDGFTKKNPYIHKMLSQGIGNEASAKAPIHMREGERFFCDEETALKWRSAMPFSERGLPRVIFSPENRWDEIGYPDLVLIFADPDCMSAIITLLGFHNGRSINTIVPYGAACHSMVFAAEQLDSDDLMAVMGLFEISQRSKALANYLSLTMPHVLWLNMQKKLDKSCLTTHAWKEI